MHLTKHTVFGYVFLVGKLSNYDKDQKLTIAVSITWSGDWRRYSAIHFSTLFSVCFSGKWKNDLKYMNQLKLGKIYVVISAIWVGFVNKSTWQRRINEDNRWDSS